MTLEAQVLDWKHLKEKSQKIIDARRYMNGNDRQKLINSYIEKVREYNLKYSTRFNISRRPDQ